MYDRLVYQTPYKKMDEQIEIQNQISNPQTPQPASTPTEPSGHRHVTAWVALVIVAAIAATAGYLVWAKAHEAWPYDNETPQTLETPKNDSNSALDMARWKTYRNEEYGFGFKYPQSVERFNVSTDSWPNGIYVTADSLNFAVYNKPYNSFGHDLADSVLNSLQTKRVNDSNSQFPNYASIKNLFGHDVLVQPKMTCGVPPHCVLNVHYYRLVPAADGYSILSFTTTDLLNEYMYMVGEKPVQYIRQEDVVDENAIETAKIILDHIIENGDIVKMYNQILSTFKFIK